MKDLIDRQAAIDALKKLLREEPNQDVWDAFYKGYDEGKVAGQLDTAMARKLNPKKSISEIATTILQSQNSRQTQGLWIPCSERLPEEQGRYLVSKIAMDLSEEYHTYIVDVDISAFTKRTGKFSKKGVYAWMPLPEPYQEVDHVPNK